MLQYGGQGVSVWDDRKVTSELLTVCTYSVETGCGLMLFR